MFLVLWFSYIYLVFKNMKNLNVNKNSVISRLINNYLLSHKFTIFFALIMMIISAGATGLHAWLVQPALDEVLIKGNKEMLFLIPIAVSYTHLTLPTIYSV